MIMKRIFLVVLLLVLLSEGVGNYVVKKLKVSKPSFTMAYGFGVILGLLQLLYYPLFLLNAPFMWLAVITSIVLGIALLLTLLSIKDVLSSFLKPKTLFLIISSCLFLFVFSKSYIDLDYSDSSTYLNYIALNINAPHLNLYNLTNGLRGPEWNVYYLFQGYFHFVSYLCWFINIPFYLLGSSFEVGNMLITIWGMGLLYHILTTSLIISVVDKLNIKNKYVYWVLLLFGTFYSNFYYWNIAYAWYGNTFRALFLMSMIWIIYLWEKENQSSYKYLLLFLSSASLASSSSSLFMSFAILYALASYLFVTKKENALKDMITILFGMVCFVVVFLFRGHPLISLLFLLLYLCLLCLQKISFIDSFIQTLDTFFKKYAIHIFFIGVPVLFMIGSFIVHLMIHNDFTSYMYYFKNFRLSDMMMDYTFIHSEPMEFILNIIRWCGVLLILRNEDSIQSKWIRSFVIIMLVFFLNPLCTILLQMTITGMVFYRNFMVLFNPVTELVFFYIVYQYWKNHKGIQYGLLGIILIITVLGNVLSFFPTLKTGLYWVYIRGGEQVDSLYKIDADEHIANMMLREELMSWDESRQPNVISQSGASLTYSPKMHQVFTSWHYHYPLDRIDEHLYELQTRKIDWEEEKEIDYHDTCSKLKEYDIDYLLIQYWASPEFDKESDACFVTFYTGSKYKVKKINNSMR